METDRAWLDAYRAGEPAALRRVVSVYGPGVATVLREGFSFRSGGRSCRFHGFRSAFDLEDHVQEVFVRACSSAARSGYDGLTPFSSYLRAVARNLVIDELRRRSRALDAFSFDEDALPAAPELGSASDALDGAIVPTGRPAEDGEASELVRLVASFVDGLPERERQVYQARFREGLEHRDVARRTGLSPSQVKTSEKRIRLELYAELRRQGYLEGYEQQPSGWLTRLRRRWEGA